MIRLHSCILQILRCFSFQDVLVCASYIFWRQFGHRSPRLRPQVLGSAKMGGRQLVCRIWSGASDPMGFEAGARALETADVEAQSTSSKLAGKMQASVCSLGRSLRPAGRLRDSLRALVFIGPAGQDLRLWTGAWPESRRRCAGNSLQTPVGYGLAWCLSQGPGGCRKAADDRGASRCLRLYWR